MGGIFFFFFFSDLSFLKVTQLGGRGIGQRSKGGRSETEQLVRSRSYPGFSIGILLSVKVILLVNSVFIPLLNEIHGSMESERDRERHDKEGRK